MTNNNKYSSLLKSELNRLSRQSPAQIEVARQKLVHKLERHSFSVRHAHPKISPKLVMIWVSGIWAIIGLLVLFFVHPLEQQKDKSMIISGLLQLSNTDSKIYNRRLTVPSNSAAKLVFADKSALWAGKGSILNARSKKNSSFFILKGKILASISKRSSLNRFSLKTRHGNIIVYGTVFSVVVAPASITVRLYKGEVTIDTKSKTFVIRPGNQAIVSNGKLIKMRPIEKTDIVSDLGITQKTANLNGPPVPKLVALSAKTNTESHQTPANSPDQLKRNSPFLNSPSQIKHIKLETAGQHAPSSPLKKDDENIEPDASDLKTPQFIDPRLEKIEIEQLSPPQ